MSTNTSLSDFPVAVGLNGATDYLIGIQYVQNVSAYLDVRISIASLFSQLPPGPVGPQGPAGTGNISTTGGTVTGGAPVVFNGGLVSGQALVTSGAVSGTGSFVKTAGATITGATVDSTVIGGTTPGAGSFTSIAGTSGAISGAFSVAGAVSGAGFTVYLASPPAIGGTAAAAGTFTSLSTGNLSSSGALSGVAFSNYLASPPAIGGTTPAAGSFTTGAFSTGLTAPTRSPGDSTTNAATTNFVTLALAAIASTAFPSPVVTKSANYTVVTADKNSQFILNGSFTLTLPSASSFGAGNGIFVKKVDAGSAAAPPVCVINTASGTIDGLGSINIYQETYSIFSDGTNWRTQGRPKGWISLGSTSIGTSVATFLLQVGFTDVEFSDHQIDYYNVTKVSASYLLLRVSKGGVVDTGANYGQSGVFGDGSSSPQTMRSSTSSFLCDGGSANTSTAKNGGQVLMKNPTSTTVTNQSIRVDGTAIGGTGLYAKIEGYNTTAGAIDGLQFSASVNLTGGTFNQRAFRP